MFVENRNDRNHLYFIIWENKHQAPKSENTNSNIVKLPWIPILGPKIGNELRKIGCRVIFISAAKLKIYYAITKVNYYQIVTRVFTN